MSTRPWTPNPKSHPSNAISQVEEIRAARDEGEREKAGLREALRRAAGSLEGKEEELAAAVKQRNALDAAVTEVRS